MLLGSKCFFPRIMAVPGCPCGTTESFVTKGPMLVASETIMVTPPVRDHQLGFEGQVMHCFK